MEVRQERWEKCESCDQRNHRYNACSLCGCSLDPENALGDKLSWEVAECPLSEPNKKWRRLDNMPHHWELKPDSPTDWTKQLFMQPPGPWPEGFEGFPSVRKAFQELLEDYSTKAPAKPTWERERGIVICGGGWRFFPSIYVTVRAIRHLGHTEPIQVWYLGDKNEFDLRMAQALAPYDVGWIDANSFHRERPETGIRRPIDHGWQLKPYAACYAPFREVIALDADSFPVRHMSHIFDHPEYRKVGACFFPDHAPLEPGQWETFGLPPCSLPGLESGQFIVDKDRHWNALWLSRFINDFYEYVWHCDQLGLKGHLYGDKDTFAIAWQRCGNEMCVPQPQPGFRKGAFLQFGFDNQIMFTHYTRNKFKFFGEVDGHMPSTFYHTAQDQPPEDFGKKNGIPLYQEACKWATECDQLIRPEAHFQFIGGGRGWCRDIWDAVTLRNEYGTPTRIDGTVIDLGANVGAFCHWASNRGAKKIFAVEPWAENIPLLQANTNKDIVTIVQKAVWKDRGGVVLSSHDQHIAGNTSTISVVGTTGERAKVVTCTLDDFIGNGQIALVKIDIEGAEGPVMAACQKWKQVKAVCGETHENVEVDGKTWTKDDIEAILKKAGYKTRFWQNGPSTYLFWAER